MMMADITAGSKSFYQLFSEVFLSSRTPFRSTFIFHRLASVAVSKGREEMRPENQQLTFQSQVGCQKLQEN